MLGRWRAASLLVARGLLPVSSKITIGRMHTHSVSTLLSAGLLTTCFALLLATRYSCMFWYRDLASPGKSRQLLASSGHESIIPCCTDFCYVQQTRLPTPETASGHSQLRPGRGPDPTTGGEANGRSWSTRQRVVLVLRKTVHQ